ncbi:MAG TPA: hypothetical protein VFS04_04665 [Alphaproteobacteria bacterium]|nr:hypothetical protein [Alphaproteobacteria bacterium]
MFDRFFKFLVLSKLPAETSITYLVRDGGTVVNFMDNIFKTRESLEYLQTRAKEDLDQKRIKFEVLSIQRNLRNCIDWEYFHNQVGAALPAHDKFKASLEKLVSTALEAASTPEGNKDAGKADLTRINLDYYKLLDFSGGKSRGLKISVYCHLMLLKAFAEAAYAIIDNTSPDSVSNDFKNIIYTSIQFPPDYYKAGMEILTHFATVIRQKYPDINVKVRIEQEDLLVRLIIDTPDGAREVIEQTLNDYHEVITGRRRPEDFLTNPTDIMELKHVLQIAEMEVRHQRDLLMLSARDNADLREQLTRYRANDQRSLEYMGQVVQQERDDAREWRALILKVIESSDERVRSALLLIEQVVEAGKIDNNAAFQEAVALIKKEKPTFFQTLLDHLQKKAAEGTVNYFVDWFLKVTGMMPHISTILPH